MRKEMILPGLALVGGLAGFALRRWELATAFEPDTGLPIAGAPATWALVGLTLVMVVLLALLCRGKYNPLPTYDLAFLAKGNTLYMLFMVAAAGLCLLAGGLGLLELPGAWEDAVAQAARHGSVPSMLTMAPRALLCILCLVSAAGLFQVGRNNYRAEGRGRFSPALLAPAYAACLWLIVSYQARSGDPVILDYAWQLFAVISAVLATYFMAGFAFERSKVFRTAVTCLGGIYLILVTMADNHSPAMLLLYGAFLLYLLASSYVLLFNAHRPMLRRTAEGNSVSETGGLRDDIIDLEEPTHE